MSTVGSALEVLQATSLKTSNQIQIMNSTATRVLVRLLFLRIGEIDTLNEKYQAQASIESRWIVDIQRLLPELSLEDQNRLNEGKSVSLIKYAETHWHPQLYIENALGDLKEQIRYSAKRSRDDQQIYVCEHRDIKGVFWEKLELQHFPSDVQDLSISIGTMFHDDKVLLINDPHHLSGVNREAFVDQQEWSLFEHVDVEQRFIREFLFRDPNEYEDDDFHEANSKENDDRKRSVLTVTCHAARQSNYFYWNGYCLIFLITGVAFCIYGIPPHLAANRIQIACTLLLTSITFRWTVNRSLPTISYLTSMDIYAIFCIFSLIIHCLWHGIIGALIFFHTKDFRVISADALSKLDQCVFIITLIIFMFIHLLFLTWLYFVPLKHRRNMAKKDIQYRLTLGKRRQGTTRGQTTTKSKLKDGPSFSRIPIGQ